MRYVYNMNNSISFEANHFQDPSFVKSAETKYQASSTTEMKLPPMQRPRSSPRLLIQDNLKEIRRKDDISI
jgi:hypothetical protein